MVGWLTESTWAGPVLWSGLYVSDYALTIACARMYRAQDKIVFEGSYEITPLYQADVNALRRVSPRFLLVLVGSTVYVALARLLAGPSSGLFGMYELVLGALILIQATVHTRHLRNWHLFARTVIFLKGRLEHPRGIMLRHSSFELIVFAGLYTGIFAVTGSLFVLGGAFACGVLALNHWRLARRHEAGLAKR